LRQILTCRDEHDAPVKMMGERFLLRLACVVIKPYRLIYTIKLSHAVTLGGAYDGDGTAQVGQQDQVTFCSER